MIRFLIRLPTAVLAASVVTLAVFPRVVLCIEMGGHVAIEPATALCCAFSWAARGAVARSAECPLHCSDTRIGFSAPTAVPDHPTPSLLAEHAALSVAAIADLHDSPQHFVWSHWVHPRLLAPRDVRTTVQRC